MSLLAADALPPELPVAEPAGPTGPIEHLERWLLTLLLVAMLLLPIADRVLYYLGGSLPSASTLVAHCTLLLALLGGLHAAASRRLIATPLLLNKLPPHARRIAECYGYGAAAAICIQLAIAGWRFALAERESSAVLLPGLPLWVVELLIPAGFTLIGLRLAAAGHGAWRNRLATALVALCALALCHYHWDPATGRLLGICALVAALLCGAPMFTLIGGLALLLMWHGAQPTAATAVKFYSLATTPVVPTLPLFAFTGYLLAESGAAQRLVRVFRAWFGGFRGGMAVATVLCCAFFTTFTGASGVTILALGGLLWPALQAAGYRDRDALGLITGSGSIGLLFPPCLPVILYSIAALQTLQGIDPGLLDQYDVSIEGMFKAAFLPGVLLVGLTMLWGRSREPRRAASGARRRFDWPEARRALWGAKWELALPLVAIGAMFGGWVSSPVQAAALTALYALIVEAFVHRDLKLGTDLPRIGAECGLLTGGILLILGTAVGLTNFLVTEQVPDLMSLWVNQYIHQPWIFLLALNFALLVVGSLMDMYSALVVVVPLIVPLALQYQVDPVHLGVIFLVNLELGFLHPPVGINLFLASYRFKRPLGDIVWSVLPMLAVVASAVLLITYWPALTHWLPSVLHR